MSLIVHTIVPDAIIAASDTRSTTRDKEGNVLYYSDTTQKTVPFQNQIVVSHCGNSFVNNNLSVTDFLIALRLECKTNETVQTLSNKILCEISKIDKNNELDITFLVSGYAEDNSTGYTYFISTKEKKVELYRKSPKYGACYEGETFIAHAFMNGIEYDTLSFNNGVSITKECVESTIKSFQYRQLKCVGGIATVYILGKPPYQSGWYRYGKIIPESFVPER